MAKHIIPFSFWPSNWGLTGSRREKAYAEYTIDNDYELRKKLAEIDYSYDNDRVKFYNRIVDIERKFVVIDDYVEELGKLAITHGYDYKNSMNFDELNSDFQYDKIDIDLKYNKITEREYDVKLSDFEIEDKESVEYKIREIEIRRKYGDINDMQAEKETATVKGESWVGILNADFLNNPTVGSGINFELDWNEFFLEELIDNGFSGRNPEEIIDSWFTPMCAEIFEEYKHEMETTMPMSQKDALGLKTTIHNIGDGKVEIS